MIGSKLYKSSIKDHIEKHVIIGKIENRANVEKLIQFIQLTYKICLPFETRVVR